MGKINSKQKGARGEREIAQILRDSGFEARRGQQFSGGDDSPDVVSNFPFHIEAKWVESLNLGNAMAQSKRDSNGKPYCVIHKKSREEWNITLPFSQFLSLLQSLGAIPHPSQDESLEKPSDEQIDLYDL